MERALKERIVGAVILVALAVLVVPVFLDGPPESGETVTERVPLPGQADQETQTVVLDRDRDEPVPAPPKPAPRASASGGTEAETEREPTEDTRASTAEPARAAIAAPDTASDAQSDAGAEVPADESATGMWAVQLGSFSNQENAERLAADLRRQNYAAFLSRLTTSNGELHRVRVGPLENREAAESMAKRLAGAGHTGQVVPHP